MKRISPSLPISAGHIARLGERLCTACGATGLVRAIALVALAAVGIANLSEFSDMQEQVPYWRIKIHETQKLAPRAFKDPDVLPTLYAFFRMKEILAGAILLVRADTRIPRVNFETVAQVSLEYRDFEAAVKPELLAELLSLRTETLEWYGKPVFHIILETGQATTPRRYRVLTHGEEFFIVPEAIAETFVR